MHAFRTYILPKFKQAAARSVCDSWASCSHLVTVHKLADEAEDWRSEWMRYAIDRRHFKRRIAVLAPTLERMLTHDHRMFIKINVLKIVTLASECISKHT